MRIGFAILNRNEQDALPSILPQIPSQGVELVFCVDGNSTDSSLDILTAHGIEIVGQRSPGRGEGFRIAF